MREVDSVECTPNDETNLAPWVEQARQGDESAATALVDALYPMVWRIARARRPVRTSEEDLAQDVFKKVFERLDQYSARGGIPFAHWVARIATRTCLDALRSERRRPELRWADMPEGEAEWLQHLCSSTADPQRSEGSGTAARELIQRLLSMLPAQDRVVLQMLDLEERSVKDIVALLGWSASLVKVRAFRARLRLKQIVKKLKLERPDELDG
jgi:RNA polymerase sigma factor (sigma-70 family)